MKKEIFDGFYAGFDNVKHRRGPGGDYPYVSADDVTDRMNRLFAGNWSSEVKDYYETNDDIVIRVRVTILDPDTNMWFYHEGFGGHRKSNRDEAGNGFKSAYSKALVNACRRWGVGLYLTDDEPQVQNTSMTQTTVPQMETPPVGGSGVPNVPPTQVSVNVPPTPAPAPANEHIPFPTEVKAPAVPNIPTPGQVNTPVKAEVTVQQEQPVATPTNIPNIPTPPVANGGQPGPTPVVPETPAPTTTDTTGGAETISDVQKVSIESLIDIYGIPYDDMVQGALGEAKPIDNLTHSEAISIIQYGHKVCKNK